MKASMPGVRLYGILARRRPLAVIFRRGPSRQVLLLTWNTESHEIRTGQWLKARIYERRCDLSPSGEKLIYFAANYREPHFTWTAVCRPPYLTALALWPKGNAWGGGGLFATERTINLNHRSDEAGLDDGYRLPKAVRVEPFGAHPGSGEDEPIWSTRLTRDGWTLKQAGSQRKNKLSSKVWIEYPDNVVWTKTRGRWTLEMRILGLHELGGPWYLTEHRLLANDGREFMSLGRSDWADWSHSGDVLLARDGRLLRIPVDTRSGPGAPVELIDLRELRFNSVEAPAEAQTWNEGSPLGRVIS